MEKEIEIYYKTCPNCETKVQYTDQDIKVKEYPDLRIDDEIPFDLYVECPECGEELILCSTV